MQPVPPQHPTATQQPASPDESRARRISAQQPAALHTPAQLASPPHAPAQQPTAQQPTARRSLSRRALLGALPTTAALTGCGAASRVSSGAAGEGGSGDAKDGTGSDAGGAIAINDVLGRTVRLPAVPQRVFLGESRQVYSLAFLNRDNPVEKIVAWPDDVMRASPDFWRRLEKAAPQASEIPVVGSLNKGDLTPETVISHDPDIVVVNLDTYESAKSGGFFEQMDRAGLPWAVTDFRIRPVKNTRISIAALGAIFDRTAEADAFLEYYDGIVGPIMEASHKRADERPLVFHWRSPGISEPGRTYGHSNFGEMTEASGGENLGSRLLPGDEGVISTEQLISEQPELIIASGGEWKEQKLDEAASTAFVHLGYDADEESARTSLEALKEEPGYDQLDAFDTGQVFGIYHQFYNAPFNFVAYQAFAQWQRLPGWEDADVAASWREFHEKFMPWEGEGVVAVGLAS